LAGRFLRSVTSKEKRPVPRYPDLPRAPRRPLNPFLLRAVAASPHTQIRLAQVAGFACPQQLWYTLRAERLPATPLFVQRLERLADVVGFPRRQIFLDGGR
jgi:hypothetical protein